jgi:tRNA(fMet)-specific endonuclease VapC
METMYLLDTNICVYFLRDKNGIADAIRKVGWNNCCISEMTVAELLYGAECSKNVESNKREVISFCNDITIIPVSGILSEYARQKALLRRNGILIDDMDLFIGCTAVTLDYIMVTENVKHLNHINGIKIENWLE